MKTSRAELKSTWRMAMQRIWNTSGKAGKAAGILAAALCVTTLLAGCSKSGTSSVSATPETFSSYDEAGKALYTAAKANDTDGLLKIFGSNQKDIVVSGDPEQDKDNQSRFAASYDQ